MTETANTAFDTRQSEKFLVSNLPAGRAGIISKSSYVRYTE